jgi:hypothetical protein
VVPFGDAPRPQAALSEALHRRWDAEAICRHAHANTWDRRVDELVGQFRRLHARPDTGGARVRTASS